MSTNKTAGPLTAQIVRENQDLALELKNNSSDLTLTAIEPSFISLKRDEEGHEYEAMIVFEQLEKLVPGEAALLNHQTRFAGKVPIDSSNPWKDAPEGNDLLIRVVERFARDSYQLHISFKANGTRGSQTLSLGTGSGLEIEDR